MNIETESDYNKFKEENISGEWFMYIVPVYDKLHPVVNNISVLFIRNLFTNKTYSFSIEHPDAIHWNVNNLILGSNKKWVFDKKSFDQMLKLSNTYDVNLICYLQENSTIDSTTYNTIAHKLIYKHNGIQKTSNLSIPLLKHQEMFDDLADDVTHLITEYVPDAAYIKFNELIIGTLCELESQGICVDREKFNKRFNIDSGINSMVYSQYNTYTVTGRPSNHYDSVNYAALNHKDGSRDCFISRFGDDGRMVLVDYATFHPRIICGLTNYKIPIETDIYEYLAKLYFHKTDIDETDIAFAKNITFRQLFGGVEDAYSYIKYFSNLKTFIDSQWEYFNNNGYVLTPFFNRKITSKHILAPTPPKIFNYILQATEGEVSIPRIKIVMDYLKSKMTRAVLYTYDSVLYDFYKGDGYNTLNDIRDIMSINGEFPLKTYVGTTYNNLKLINI